MPLVENLNSFTTMARVTLFLLQLVRTWTVTASVTFGSLPLVPITKIRPQPRIVQNHETFKNLHFDKISTSDLNLRLQGLSDASALNNVIGLQDFNATSGL